MLLYPAIDIRDGHAVRLVRGDYSQETVYDADPLDAARRWVDHGASALHVVDLDGARSGRPENLDAVRRICADVEVPVQVGGGLRDADSALRAITAGASRVVLGTAALEQPELVVGLAADHGLVIVVGVDTRGGRVAVEGWERETQATPAEVIEELGGRGVREFVYTPVEVDGTLEGPALEGVREVAHAAQATGGEVLYSGGIGTLEDLEAIARLRLPGLGGVIVGRALYEERFKVAEGQAVLGG